jgi:hypothetical protein
MTPTPSTFLPPSPSEFSCNRGRGTPGHVLQFVFAGRREVPNSPFYVIYYIMNSAGFAVASSDHHEGAPGPRCPGKTRALFYIRSMLHVISVICLV